MIIPIFLSQNQPINYLSWVESISVIIASGFAIWGILTWRKETRWKRKYELAEEVLANIYEAQRDIREIRMPVRLVWFDESELKADNETKIRTEAHNYNERIAQNRAAYDRLESLKFRFMIAFGKEYEKHIIELRKIYNRLYWTNNEVARIKLSSYVDKDELKRKNDILFSIENDPIENKINEMVKDIENVCIGIIGKK